MKLPNVRRELFRKGKFHVYLIGFIHLVIVFVGIALVVAEEIEYQEPFRPIEAYILVVHWGGHFMILSTYFYAIYQEEAHLLLPWIISIFVVAVGSSVQFMFYLKDIYSDTYLIHLQYVILLGCVWYAWKKVFIYFNKICVKSVKK